MPLAEERALEILNELIKKPETAAAEIPLIWSEILAVYDRYWAPAPAPEPVKKKRRKRTMVDNPNLGWPKGIKREAYLSWRESQRSKGVTEGINPREYARSLEGTDAASASPPAAPTEEAKPKRKPAAKK